MKFEHEPLHSQCHGPVAAVIPLFLGSAATAATATAAATAATAGLFGVGGAFALGATLSTLGTAFAAFSVITGAGAQAGAADFNAAQAERDRALTIQQTETLKQQNEAALTQADRERRLRLGANIAKGGARGLGQPLDILRDNAAQEELNILTIKQQGALQQRAGVIQAQGFGTQAELERAKAETARTQGRLGVGATVLSGIPKIKTALG